MCGCSRQERSWKQAEKANSITSYQAYLKEFPEGRYASRADFLIDSLYWAPIGFKGAGKLQVGMIWNGIDASGAMSVTEQITFAQNNMMEEVLFFPGTVYNHVPEDSVGYKAYIQYTNRYIPINDNLMYEVEGLHLTQAIGQCTSADPDTTQIFAALDKILKHIWLVSDSKALSSPLGTLTDPKVLSESRKAEYKEILINKLRTMKHELLLVTGVKCISTKQNKNSTL